MRNAILVLLLLAAAPAARADKGPASLDVKSSAFNNNEAIPTEYSCEGAQLSPPLSWSKVPAETKSIAILVEDPDAPSRTFTHWLVTGIPATTTSLGKGAALPAGAMASRNDKGQQGYAGPCPPSGRHHYHFHVYALDIGLPKTMTRAELLKGITGHVLATGDLVGTYQRQRGR
ncbi:MAG TPA: YbhB/YbcL family Raf kinase inhibitor-like protein [Kofleriaceae bacterium]|nr:YbhB/YbcL family Raf kinase inhibitor-like protein [Kofleriaceae bacterium]